MVRQILLLPQGNEVSWPVINLRVAEQPKICLKYFVNYCRQKFYATNAFSLKNHNKYYRVFVAATLSPQFIASGGQLY